MKKICLVGYGAIGKPIYKYLADLGYLVSVFDTNPNLKSNSIVDTTDIVSDPILLESILSKHDAVVVATPYMINIQIAEAAAKIRLPYFDITEDVRVTTRVRQLAAMYNTVMIPQCGLAPGAVSIIANDLAKKFDVLHNVKIRVGALPLAAENGIRYHLSWSLEGLINEYMKPCFAILNGKQVEISALSDYEQICLDGCQYEIFNTSGGLGTLYETLKPTKSLTYKTLRYPGHLDKIKFLINDLGLTEQEMISLFRGRLPYNREDVVVIHIETMGLVGNQLETNNYYRKIYGDSQYAAIQKTTAGGVVSVVNAYFKDAFGDRTGYIPNEALSFKDFIDSKYGSIYK